MTVTIKILNLKETVIVTIFWVGSDKQRIFRWYIGYKLQSGAIGDMLSKAVLKVIGHY